MNIKSLQKKFPFSNKFNLDVLRPHIRIHSWGAYEVDDWDYPSVYQPCWILHYNFTRGLQLKVNGKDIFPGPDKVFLFPPFTHFSGKMKKPFFQFFVHFLMIEPVRKVKPEMITLNSEYIRELLEDLARYSADFEMRSIVLHNIVQTSFTRIPQKYFLPENKNTIDPRIHAILMYIDRNPVKKHHVKALAEMAKMSENHFRRCFLAAAGRSPKLYIQEKRLKYARDLLSQTDKSIEEIAESAGFANRYHFSQAFKKNYLFSPGEYKKKYGLMKRRTT